MEAESTRAWSAYSEGCALGALRRPGASFRVVTIMGRWNPSMFHGRRLNANGALAGRGREHAPPPPAPALRAARRA
jgi:hypothetical protein